MWKRRSWYQCPLQILFTDTLVCMRPHTRNVQSPFLICKAVPLICLDEQTHIQIQQEQEMKGLYDDGQLKRLLTYAVAHKHTFTWFFFWGGRKDSYCSAESRYYECITKKNILLIIQVDKAQSGTWLKQNILTTKKKDRYIKILKWICQTPYQSFLRNRINLNIHLCNLTPDLSVKFLQLSFSNLLKRGFILTETLMVDKERSYLPFSHTINYNSIQVYL